MTLVDDGELNGPASARIDKLLTVTASRRGKEGS